MTLQIVILYIVGLLMVLLRVACDASIAWSYVPLCLAMAFLCREYDVASLFPYRARWAVLSSCSVLLLLAAPLWAQTGTITAARIVGATTTVSDATSACNTSGACNGWVLELDETVSGWTSSGEAYSLGIGATGSVANAKIVLTVGSTTGFTNSGGTTTYARTLWATHQIRKIYNAGYTPPYPNDETNVSTTLTMRFALGSAPRGPGDVPDMGYVFSTDSSITVTAAAGIYTYSSTPSLAVSGLSVTNNSTLAFPKAIANWTRPSLQRITGSTLKLCSMGFSQGAHDGRPLAAMIFSAADAHAHTATDTETLPIIDSSQGDASKVQEYCGTLTLTGFTQADLVTAQFQAVPWLGVTASIMDTSDAANAALSPLYSPQLYINDAAGTFGTAAAVVDGTLGNDSTCVAVSEATFNASPNSNAANSSPCLTHNKAAVLIRAFNAANSSPSRTDEAGSIWTKAGTYTWTGASVSISAHAGTNPDKSWLTVQPFPGVAQSSVIISGITSTSYNMIATAPVHIYNITVNVTSGTPVEIFNTNSSTGTYLWIDHCALTMTSGTTFVYTWAAVYWTQNTVVSNGTCGNGATSSCVINGFTEYGSTSPAALIRGNTLTGIANTIRFYTMVGNVFASPVVNTSFQVVTADTAVPITSTAPILAFNKFYNLKYSSQPLNIFQSLASPLGAYIVLNLFEYNSAASSPILCSACDGSTNTPVNNVNWWNNTQVGQRGNIDYNDSGSSPIYRTLWGQVGQLIDSSAIKSDTFVTANAGRVGNWPGIYSVGFWGTVDAESGTSAHPVGVAGLFQPEFPGIHSNFIIANTDAQQSLQPPACGACMHATTWLAFVDRESWNGTTIGSGNGNYHIYSNSGAVNARPAGGCVLPYDLDGQLCNNSGWGAAGAYEVPTNTQVFGW